MYYQFSKSQNSCSTAMVSSRAMFHVLLLPVYLFVTCNIHFSSAQPNFRIAKPKCTDFCGNTSIPFPFGMAESCYGDYYLHLTCNRTFNPPKLFLQDTSLEIVHISLDGQLRVMNPIAKKCYARNGSLIHGIEPVIDLPRLFTVNHTANRFTIIGCDSDGYMSGFWAGPRSFEGNYARGCIATCRSVFDTHSFDFTGTAPCSGLGCCQVNDIPKSVSYMELSIGSVDNHKNVWEFSNCTYGFIIEESGFTFYSENLTNMMNVEKLPMVVDWAIGQDMCPVARLNSSGYGCKSLNSECYMPNVHGYYGYRCRCNQGYQGNPYLDNGCQDINECNALGSNTNCTYKCENTVGSFRCICPKGYLGNGIGEHGCYCPKGRIGDGVREGGCFPADEDQCEFPEHSNCTYNCVKYGRTSFRCKCPEGYQGDGIGDHGCSCMEGYTNHGIREGGCTIHRVDPIYKLVAGVAVGAIILMLLICLIYIQLSKRRLKKIKEKCYIRNGGILLEEKLKRNGTSPDAAKIFRSTELQKATNNFHNNMIVGQGGFGVVYRGVLPADKRLVAIKKSKQVDPTQIDQFINEIIVLSQINHRNVVKLLGCCLETQVPLLVYEFVGNGTLSEHLHNEGKRLFLNWNLRLKIAIETANVLSYLHSAASTPIIHRDVKSANILLEHDLTAKVSDFGASRLVPDDQTRLSTMVQGTRGYLDPEYMQTEQLTEKSDVYSFGVVLLELLTGMRVISFDRPEEDTSLPILFLRRLREKLLFEIIDKTIIYQSAVPE